MKTITVELYEYDELPTEEAKERARDWYLPCGFDHEWWESTYEDAELVGLKITSFDLDRNKHAKGKFIMSAAECAELIRKEHGPDTDTYKTADAFLKKRDEVVDTEERDTDGSFVSEVRLDDRLDIIEDDFLKAILEDYASILQNEADYMQSTEYLEEGIRANGYTFTEDGKRMD